MFKVVSKNKQTVLIFLEYDKKRAKLKSGAIAQILASEILLCDEDHISLLIIVIGRQVTKQV